MNILNSLWPSYYLPYPLHSLHEPVHYMTCLNNWYNLEVHLFQSRKGVSLTSKWDHLLCSKMHLEVLNFWGTLHYDKLMHSFHHMQHDCHASYQEPTVFSLHDIRSSWHHGAVIGVHLRNCSCILTVKGSNKPRIGSVNLIMQCWERSIH